MEYAFDQNPEEDDLLREQREELQNFWDIETIASPDENVICKFECNIDPSGFRCVTKFTFKPDHDLLPRNNETVKADWLKDKILNQYNEIFLDWKTGYRLESCLGRNNSISRQITLFGS